MATHRNDPLAGLPGVPRFTVTSANVDDGRPMPAVQRSRLLHVPGGEDRSPQLEWSGAPARTRSFTVTMYDPDASTGSGFWHWVVTDIPAGITSLSEGAGGEEGSGLPDGARHVHNDARLLRYVGAAPPPGDAPHRYFIIVNALSVASVDVPDGSTPAFLGSTSMPHLVGRAVLVPLAASSDVTALSSS